MNGGRATTVCVGCSEAFDAVAAHALTVDCYDIVQCPHCELIQRAELPSREEHRALYAADYFVAAEGTLGSEGYLDYVADAEFHRTNARRRLGRLARYVAPGRLLDVGCAAGFFVDEARHAGWSARGIDVSAPMVTWGVEHLGVELEVGEIAATPVSEPECCVTMWDYLEHSLDPRGDVAAAFGRLRPGGVLALSTGDVGSVVASASLRRWHLMTPRHHLAFFSGTTIRRLLQSVGFEVTWLGAPAAVYPLRYVAHKSSLLVDSRLVQSIARLLDGSRAGAIGLPLNLWDVMTVIARRPMSAGERR